MTASEDNPAPCAQPGISAYRRGCRCQGCRAANTAKCQQGHERRVAKAADADFEHGASGYKNWGCRCPVCTKANTAAGRGAVQRFAAKHPGTEAPNRYTRWTPQETRLLLSDALTNSEIAVQLGRSYTAVATKRSQVRKAKETTDADA
ncbi:hypothetical protein [Streptomyces cylindrosporus]|uniref:HTH luxR-type domain-containing protein n=1 Tax=Streptomyces cylindrosporus TaxID=2927583 RepID=A0ABS9YJQ9_9ACTN|nr:hypothetical protein [Streptomyces cylindrosporus]MCI3277493.1 hypothetical protein [Streptomyces cylindrosporus]